MINELRGIAQAMEASGVCPKHVDPRLAPCSKHSTKVLARLMRDGSVHVEKAQTDGEFLKYGISNGHTFPAFNVPLLVGINKSAKNDADALEKKIKEALASQTPLDQDNIGRQVKSILSSSNGWAECLHENSIPNRCLKKIPLEFIGALGGVPDRFKSISELSERAKSLDLLKLRSAIEDFVVNEATSNPSEGMKLLRALSLASKSDEKFMVVLDAGMGEFDLGVHCHETREWVNETLLSQAALRSISHDSGEVDAYGEPMPEGSQNMPEANGVACLGNVRLRAMSDESLCNQRYGMLRSAGFPVGHKTASQCKAALEWIGDKEREGVTWAKIDGKKSAIFAYMTKMDNNAPPEIACLFSGPDEIDFEQASQKAISALSLQVSKPGRHVKLMILEKPAEKSSVAQVAYHKECSPEYLVSRADLWNTQGRSVNLECNVGNKARQVLVTPKVPYPSEMVRLLNHRWICEGKEKKEAKSFSYNDGISLFMGNDWIAQAMLHAAIRNWTGLLLSLGEADHRRDGNPKVFCPKFKKEASLAIGALSILMAKARKGPNMPTPCHTLGRLLALSDVVHAEYCRVVRKGQMPPKLFGSSLVSAALQSPRSCYARFAERLVVYQSWAETHGSPRAKKALGQMRELSPSMQEVAWPKPDDATKGEVITGFLSKTED